MIPTKIVNLEVHKATQRDPDVVFEVRFWRLQGTRWWHEPYSLTCKGGQPEPSTLRMLGHAIVDDGQSVWDLGGAPRPPKRKVVKARRGRRR